MTDAKQRNAGTRRQNVSRAASIAATSIFFMRIIASNARFASAPPAAIASVSPRGVICQETPYALTYFRARA